MTLADIADLNPATDISNLAPTDLVSFVPMSDVSDDGRWLSNDARPLEAVRRGYTAFREGDVLFAKITPCMENGKGCQAIGLIKGVGFGSTEFHVLRPKANADLGYVFQWTRFKELRQQAANAMTGSAGQQRVPEEFLRRFPITEHRPEERSRIADILALVDRAIDQMGALLAKQQRVKAGLMHDLLTRGLDARGRLRDPATHSFKRSRFGNIPKEWRPSTVGAECTEVCVGIVIRPTQYYSEQGVIALRSLNIMPGFFDLSNVVRISHDANEKLTKSRLNEGDVVTVRTGEPGTSAVVGADLAGSNCIDLVISRHGKKLRPGFLALWMNSAFGKKHVGQNQGGLAQQHFNVGEMKILPIPLPEPEEQDAIVLRSTAMNRVVDDLNDNLAKLRRLKTGLMQDLLTGRVPVTPLLVNKTN